MTRCVAHIRMTRSFNIVEFPLFEAVLAVCFSDFRSGCFTKPASMLWSDAFRPHILSAIWQSGHLLSPPNSAERSARLIYVVPFPTTDDIPSPLSPTPSPDRSPSATPSSPRHLIRAHAHVQPRILTNSMANPPRARWGCLYAAPRLFHLFLPGIC